MWVSIIDEIYSFVFVVFPTKFWQQEFFLYNPILVCKSHITSGDWWQQSDNTHLIYIFESTWSYSVIFTVCVDWRGEMRYELTRLSVENVYVTINATLCSMPMLLRLKITTGLPWVSRYVNFLSVDLLTSKAVLTPLEIDPSGRITYMISTFIMIFKDNNYYYLLLISYLASRLWNVINNSTVYECDSVHSKRSAPLRVGECFQKSRLYDQLLWMFRTSDPVKSKVPPTECFTYQDCYFTSKKLILHVSSQISLIFSAIRWQI